MTFSSTAPAHPHATRVAVYPALLYMFITLKYGQEGLTSDNEHK